MKLFQPYQIAGQWSHVYIRETPKMKGYIEGFNVNEKGVLFFTGNYSERITWFEEKESAGQVRPFSFDEIKEKDKLDIIKGVFKYG